MSDWISVVEKPIPHGEQVIAGLYVTDSKKTYFERYIIEINEDGHIVDEYCEFNDCWAISDFEYWCYLPEPPK